MPVPASRRTIIPVKITAARLIRRWWIPFHSLGRLLRINPSRAIVAAYSHLLHGINSAPEVLFYGPPHNVRLGEKLVEKWGQPELTPFRGCLRGTGQAVSLAAARW